MIRTTTRNVAVLGFLIASISACAEAGAGNPPPNHNMFALDASCGGDAGTGGNAGNAGTSGDGAAGIGGTAGAGGIGATGGVGGISGTGGGAGVGGSAGDAGVGGSAGGDPMCDLPATNPEFICDPTGDGPCQTCHDCQQIESGAAKTAAKECGTSCGTDRECTTSCVKDRVGASEACTECLADFYDCLISTCLAECVVGGDLCTSCSRTKHDANGLSCSDKWFTCSGTELNPNF